MSSRLPSTRITPADVIAFSQKRGQKPTTEEAERWLSRQRKCIEEMMRETIEKNLEEILSEAMTIAYPDPAFDEQYKIIDDAIFAAAEGYAATIDREYYGSSHTEIEMIEVVRRMLANQGDFVACVAYEHQYGKPFKDFFVDRKVTHRTARVHITRENGKVTVDIIKDDRCDHGHDIFMPEKLRNLH